jgi:cytoskeletal protein CcmA (bactofilin family)
MIVGAGISLSGAINSCDRLVIEGSVQANLHNCRDLKIAESGFFNGNAEIDEAEIRGRFEGYLVVRKRLTICANGNVSGMISYKEIEIEVGGKSWGQSKPQVERRLSFRGTRLLPLQRATLSKVSKRWERLCRLCQPCLAALASFCCTLL